MGAGGDAMSAAMTVAVALALAVAAVILTQIVRDIRSGACVCPLCEADDEISRRHTATAALTPDDIDIDLTDWADTAAQIRALPEED